MSRKGRESEKLRQLKPILKGQGLSLKDFAELDVEELRDFQEDVTKFRVDELLSLQREIGSTSTTQFDALDSQGYGSKHTYEPKYSTSQSLGDDSSWIDLGQHDTRYRSSSQPYNSTGFQSENSRSRHTRQRSSSFEKTKATSSVQQSSWDYDTKQDSSHFSHKPPRDFNDDDDDDLPPFPIVGTGDGFGKPRSTNPSTFRAQKSDPLPPLPKYRRKAAPSPSLSSYKPQPTGNTGGRGSSYVPPKSSPSYYSKPLPTKPGKCKHTQCNNPVWKDKNGKTFDFCNRTCAKNFQNGLPPSQPKTSPSHTNPKQATCKYLSCPKQVHGSFEFCGLTHGNLYKDEQAKEVDGYHQTSKALAQSILSSSFKCGSQGIAGGGIYFATDPANTGHKAHNKGHMLKARIKIGRQKTLYEVKMNMNLATLKKQGYDSVLIVGGKKMSGSFAVSSNEIVVYDPKRIRIVEHYKCDGAGNVVGMSTIVKKPAPASKKKSGKP